MTNNTALWSVFWTWWVLTTWGERLDINESQIASNKSDTMQQKVLHAYTIVCYLLYGPDSLTTHKTSK